MEPERIEKSHAFAAPFKEKRKAFNLTCSSSTLYRFMSTQTMWNSLRWVWGSSLASPLIIDSMCMNPDLSSKLALLLMMFMHNGWFSTLREISSLTVCYCVTTMMLMRASFCNLRKVFSILRSTCTCSWSVDQITGINSQENLNKLKINQSQERFKVLKVNKNPMLKHNNA